MRHYESDELINVGWGEDVSIRELAEMVGESSDSRASCASMPPNRTARRASCSMLRGCSALGWRPRIGLRDGIAATYEWFQKNEGRYRS